MKKLHTLMFPLILFSTLTICLPSYADDTTIYGCYKKNQGQLRIVDQGSECLPSEVGISWSQAGSKNGASVTVRQMEPGPCNGKYGWCPNGFTWTFHILDSAVNGSSVVALNIVNPYLYDYGCEVAAKSVGEFQIMCIGGDFVTQDVILQYAVFNP